jgi:hypothetical protein
MIIVALAAYFLAPKPEIPESSVEDFETATAKEGAVIGVIFGTVDIKSPNVVWYGDVSAEPIRSKGGKK